MNVKNQQPVLVPQEHRSEIEELSKAALMDMVWDYSAQFAAAQSAHANAPGDPMREFRQRRKVILTHRKNAQ